MTLEEYNKRFDAIKISFASIEVRVKAAADLEKEYLVSNNIEAKVAYLEGRADIDDLRDHK